MIVMQKRFLILSAFISLIIIILSFIFEYYYKLIPCKLCLIQRYMWFFVFIFFVLALLNITKNKIIALMPKVILFVLSLTALYHSGIEVGFIKNLFSCNTTSGLDATNIEELSNIIMNTENKDCAFPKFSFYGITLSNLSFAGSFLLLLFNLQVTRKILFNKYES